MLCYVFAAVERQSLRVSKALINFCINYKSLLYFANFKKLHKLYNFISFYSIAAGCYIVHYVKRILETIFVHRFSHATMPIRNLFKNCSYYWGFTAYVSYHVNHPLFTSPCCLQVWGSLAAFAVYL